MILKNITIGILAIGFFSGCAQNVALLGPAYTLATTGNVFHAGFTYSGNEIVTQATGKSVVENFKEALIIKKEDNELQKLVKKNIKKTRKKLNSSNQ